MKQPENPGANLTRRHWMVLSASALSAGCGGGVDLASLPGTGGTGIFAQGPISGFGSVIINTIRFDEAAAVVRLDGQSATAADLRLGMVASVQGERGADVTLGRASSIEVWSIAQGLVSAGQATPGASGQFTLAGMTLLTDPNTVFEGSTSAKPLGVGQRVAVWGLQAGADARSWRATRVAIATSTAVVNTGFISVASSRRNINGMMLSGEPVRSLAEGVMVRVLGSLSTADGSLEVQSVELPGPTAAASQQGEAEIKGLVTSAPSASGFNLGSITVDASHASYEPANARITLGASVEVGGTWQAGVLKASRIELQDAQKVETVELSGRIEAFTSLSNFVVRGQRCDASGVSIAAGTLAALKVDARIKLKGIKAGDVLRVTEIALDN